MTENHACSMPPIHWLAIELFDDWSTTRDFALLREFLSELEGFERDYLLNHIFWRSLSNNDWLLSDHCIAAGYPLAPQGDDLSDWGPLHDAMSHLGNCPNVIAWLLNRGAYVEQRGNGNDTPLIAAASSGFEEVVLVLLDGGADVNASTGIDDDVTALLAAARAGNQRVVELLISRGADIHRVTKWEEMDAESSASANGHHCVAAFIRSAKTASARQR